MSDPGTRVLRIGGRNWRLAEVLLMGLVAAYFLGKLLYFAATIVPGLPPDEETHVGIARLYSETLLTVDDSPASYPHGLVTHVPYLYHLMMGKLLALNLFGTDDYLYLRLWNVLLGMVTVAVAYRLVTRLSDDLWVRGLFLVLFTNTLMYTFLSAAVTYDNLVNLLAVVSLYFLVAFFQNDSSTDLCGFLASVGLGCRTKTTFLPLALVLVVILMIERRRRLLGDLKGLAGSFRSPSSALMMAATIVVLIATAWLYGTNLIRFGRPVPNCDQVLQHDQCMENRIFARNWVVGQYREGVFSYEQAVSETAAIRHEGDREHALRLLNNERLYRQTRPEPVNRFGYTMAVWNQAIKPTVFGVQAHESMLRSPNSLLPYNLIFLAAAILWVRGLSWKGDERSWLYMAVVALAYFVILVAVVNYGIYRRTHAPFLGVQGRYVFPVIVPAYLVMTKYLLRPFGKWGQAIVAVIATTVFVLGEMPYFQSHAGGEWFR
jgi:hypothetical protein